MSTHSYRGWFISFTHLPDQIRELRWSATSPDYDFAPGEDGFLVWSGRVVCAASFEALMAEIDKEEGTMT